MTADESAALLVAANGLRNAAAAADRVRILSAQQLGALKTMSMENVPEGLVKSTEEAVDAQGAMVAGLTQAANALEKCARCGGS